MLRSTAVMGEKTCTMGKAGVTFSLSSGFNSRLSHDLFIFRHPTRRVLPTERQNM